MKKKLTNKECIDLVNKIKQNKVNKKLKEIEQQLINLGYCK